VPCNLLTDPTGCLGGATAGQGAPSAMQGWDAICQSFTKAAQQLLGSFAKSFVAIPPVDLSAPGVRSVYGLSLEIAGFVAAVLLMLQVIRTVLTHDGSAIAHGLVGIGKAVVAFVLTLGVAAVALRVSDELTRWIIASTFGSPQALSARLSDLVSFDPSVSPSLLLILALIGILVTVVLWAQLLLRNVAVAVLVAVSPIAAAGHLAVATHLWWRKLVRTTLQLIALKPAVALVFAVGLTLPGSSGQVEKLLTGMLVLLLAASAWPAMARVSSVAEAYTGSATLSGVREGVSARAPGGVNPAELSRVAEARTMSVVQESAARAAEAARSRQIAALSKVPRVVAAAVGAGADPPATRWRHGGTAEEGGAVPAAASRSEDR